jgi:outer membrane protein OmpA-like peptidoglycan-associated protein
MNLRSWSRAVVGLAGGGLLVAGALTGCGQQDAPSSPPAPAQTAVSTPEAEPTQTGDAGSGTTDRAALQAQIDQILAATPITFAPDAATLTSSGAEAVDKVAVLLAPAADVGVKLIGHVAPTPGNPSNAQQLSEQRAETVSAALISKGVAADRIQTEGAGDTAPKGDAAASRRVEVQLI